MNYDSSAKTTEMPEKKEPELHKLLFALSEEINLTGARSQDIYSSINAIKNVRVPQKGSEGEIKKETTNTLCSKLEFEIGRLHDVNSLLTENKIQLENLVGF